MHGVDWLDRSIGSSVDSLSVEEPFEEQRRLATHVHVCTQMTNDHTHTRSTPPSTPLTHTAHREPTDPTRRRIGTGNRVATEGGSQAKQSIMASPPGSQDDHPPLGEGAGGGVSFGFLNEFDDGGPRYQVGGRWWMRMCVGG